jgi:hypothetical protein
MFSWGRDASSYAKRGGWLRCEAVEKWLPVHFKGSASALRARSIRRVVFFMFVGQCGAERRVVPVLFWAIYVQKR